MMSFKNAQQENTMDDLRYLASIFKSGNKDVARRVCTDMKNKYALSSNVRNGRPDYAHLQNDIIAQRLLPDDVPYALIAKKSTPNGSCFYNSISLSLVGSERLSLTLRILIAIEIFENANWYCNRIDEIISEKTISMSKTSLFVMITSCEDINPSTDSVKVIENVAAGTCNPFAWASLIHFMAAASVLQRPVFSVYPKYGTGEGMRSLYHAQFRPRTNHDHYEYPVFVMWTTLSASTQSNWFRPNHFVPLFPTTKFQKVTHYGKPPEPKHFVPVCSQAEFWRQEYDAEFPPLLQTRCKDQRKRYLGIFSYYRILSI